MPTTRLGKGRAQHQAFLRSLADSLVLNESIETTLPRAKAVARYAEKLVSKAKKGKDNLQNRRLVLSRLSSAEAAHKLVDEITPKLSERNSGFFRIERTSVRMGDNAQLAKVSFVDDLKSAKKAVKPTTEKPSTKKTATDSPETESKQRQARVRKDAHTKVQPKMTAKAPKRAGVRGNR